MASISRPIAFEFDDRNHWAIVHRHVPSRRHPGEEIERETLKGRIEVRDREEERHGSGTAHHP